MTITNFILQCGRGGLWNIDTWPSNELSLRGELCAMKTVSSSAKDVWANDTNLLYAFCSPKIQQFQEESLLFLLTPSHSSSMNSSNKGPLLWLVRGFDIAMISVKIFQVLIWTRVRASFFPTDYLPSSFLGHDISFLSVSLHDHTSVSMKTFSTSSGNIFLNFSASLTLFPISKVNQMHFNLIPCAACFLFPPAICFALCSCITLSTRILKSLF